MIKNISIYFILAVLHFSAQTKSVENLIIETENRELIHLITTAENKPEIIKQLPILYTQNLKEIYKFTNLTPHRALVKYKNDRPFQHKGYELKSGKCLYIHKNDFDHLSIIWNSEIICSSNENKTLPCQPMDYTLNLISQQQTFIYKDTPSLPVFKLIGYYEFSYMKNLAELPNIYIPSISLKKPPYLILLQKDSNTEEECETF